MAELASHQGWLENIDAVSRQLDDGTELSARGLRFTRDVETALKLSGQQRAQE